MCFNSPQLQLDLETHITQLMMLVFNNWQLTKIGERDSDRKRHPEVGKICWPFLKYLMNLIKALIWIPENDLEQNLNKGIWALWENLWGCKAREQVENFEQMPPEDSWPAESERAAIKEKRGTRSMTLKPTHLKGGNAKIYITWPARPSNAIFCWLLLSATYLLHTVMLEA